MSEEYKRRILNFLREYIDYPPGYWDRPATLLRISQSILYLIQQNVFTAAELKAEALRSHHIIIPDSLFGGAA